MGMYFKVLPDSSVEVSWDHIPGIVTYQLQLKAESVLLSTDTVSGPDIPGSKHYFTYPGLTPGVQYTAQIRYVSGGQIERQILAIVFKENDRVSRIEAVIPTQTGLGQLSFDWALTNANGYRCVLSCPTDETFVPVEGMQVPPVVYSGLNPRQYYRLDVTPSVDGFEGETTAGGLWLEEELPRPVEHRTAARTTPPLTQGDYQLLYRPYQELMRPVRETELFWRQTDKVSFASCRRLGSTRANPQVDKYRAIINPENPSQLIVQNQTVPTVDPVLVLSHTKEVIALGLEFDQTARPLLVFEDVDHDIWLYWYDSLAGQQVVTGFGSGRTPVMVTDSHDHYGTTVDTQRYVLYLRNSDNKLIIRKQHERYVTAHEFDQVGSGNLLEILQAGKCWTGEITVIGIYEESGVISQRTLSFLNDGIDYCLGTDDEIKERMFLQPYSDVYSITLKDVKRFVDGVNENRIADEQLTATPQSDIASFTFKTAIHRADITEPVNTTISNDVVSITVRDTVIREELQESINSSLSNSILNFTVLKKAVKTSNGVEVLNITLNNTVSSITLS